MAQELLITVYDEYKRYCDKLRKPVRQVHATDPQAQIDAKGCLVVKKSEVVTGQRRFSENESDKVTPAVMAPFNHASPSFTPNFQTNAAPFTPSNF